MKKQMKPSEKVSWEQLQDVLETNEEKKRFLIIVERTVQSSYKNLDAALEKGDYGIFRDFRHSFSPTLTQLGFKNLLAGFEATEEDDQWRKGVQEAIEGLRYFHEQVIDEIERLS